MSSGQPILIAYDGSDASRDAIRQAARLFPDSAATVLTVWSSVAETAAGARVALPADVLREAAAKIDEAAGDAALQLATEGAELATEAGLAAEAATARAEPSIAAAVVTEAERREASTIIVGSRGRSRIKSTVLGSVSSAVLQQSRRPVLVVHDDPATA